MLLQHPSAQIYIPDDQPLPSALSRITHLGIGAHQDDLEFMAFHGIIACLNSPTQWFGGVTCTDGAGSARSGPYTAFTDTQMIAERRNEQRAAARLGNYAAMLQLGYASSVTRDPSDLRLQQDLAQILIASTPEIVYTHNPADKHPSHIAVVIPVIQAIRSLPKSLRPQAVHGCEVWRSLDWMLDQEKITHDVSGHDSFAAHLNGLFSSQISGGKRYDLAVIGRRHSNATFFNSHGVDQSSGLAFAIDLTPLILDDSLNIIDYVSGFIDRFKADVVAQLQSFLRQ
ncbi:MAG: PIG-L family deacetylase [Verrucomicrobia bacterium]|nr:PIG-L family deacetylase [Verrucomicrobiota bacterium]